MDKLTLIAGPCAIESIEQTMEIALAVKQVGVDYFRGGIFKPRSSPHRWDGIREPGIEILKEVKQLGLKIVTEAMSYSQIELLYPIVDVFQIGSRNMQDSELLRVFGQQDKPVVLKRGMGTTIEELVMAADFIKVMGNEKIWLCERGIRTFEPYTRNTFDINCIPAVKELSDLPIIADPSHGTGRRGLVIPIALAAVAAGVDGLMIEVHNDPDNAKTDGEQSLTIKQFFDAVPKIKKVAAAVGRYVGNA